MASSRSFISFSVDEQRLARPSSINPSVPLPSKLAIESASSSLDRKISFGELEGIEPTKLDINQWRTIKYFMLDQPPIHHYKRFYAHIGLHMKRTLCELMPFITIKMAKMISLKRYCEADLENSLHNPLLWQHFELLQFASPKGLNHQLPRHNGEENIDKIAPEDYDWDGQGM